MQNSKLELDKLNSKTLNAPPAYPDVPFAIKKDDSMVSQLFQTVSIQLNPHIFSSESKKRKYTDESTSKSTVSSEHVDVTVSASSESPVESSVNATSAASSVSCVDSSNIVAPSISEAAVSNAAADTKQKIEETSSSSSSMLIDENFVEKGEEGEPTALVEQKKRKLTHTEETLAEAVSEHENLNYLHNMFEAEEVNQADFAGRYVDNVENQRLDEKTDEIPVRVKLEGHSNVIDITDSL